jgi:G6PDH family F420-dependent oxidoreductase
VQVLADGRFTLGLGAGENLNEHVVGAGWPPTDVRHEMLSEAIEIMRTLWEGGYRSYRGIHFTVEDARIFDLPDRPIPIAVAASGPESVRLAIEQGDELVATDPDGELVRTFRDARGAESHATCQIPVCVGPDRGAAMATAHRMFRWSPLGWKVMAELPNPVNFDAASSFVTPEDVAERIPCGDDVEAVVDAARRYADAGFDRIAFVQIGEDQQSFFRMWEESLRDRLVAELGSRSPALTGA